LHTWRGKRNQKNSTCCSRAAPAEHKDIASSGIIRVADKIKVKRIQFTTLQSLEEAADNRHVGWLKFNWNDRWEEGQYWV